MSQPIIALYILTFIASISLLLVVIRRAQRDRSKTNFILFLTFILGWLVTLFLFYLISNEAVVLFLGRINFALIAVAVTFLLYFALSFHTSEPISLWVYVLTGLETASLAIVSTFTSLISAEEIIQGPSRVTHYGVLYPWFIIHFVGYVFLFAIISSRRLRKLVGIQRIQLAYIIGGIVLAAIFGTVTNIAIPLLTKNYDVQNLGPFAAFMIIGFTTYGITRHGLFNVRVISTEVLVATLLLVGFAQLILAPTILLFLLYLLVLVLLGIVGVLLMRSVVREHESAEKIQHLNEKLQRANIEIKKVYKAKSEFLDIASHQLRTPVTVIVGTLDMFREGSVDNLPKEKRDEMLRRAYLKAEKLNSIVADVLSAAEMDVPKFDVPKTSKEIDLRKVIKKVIRLNKDEAEANGLELRMDIPDTLPLIRGSEQYLGQAVTNLITNAIKYTKEGSITVSVRQEGDDVVLAVTDTGMGVPKEHIPRLFEKFSRAENARLKLPDGSGLGLFIVKKIIEGHKGGRVFVESEEGKGSTFGFRLPIVK